MPTDYELGFAAGFAQGFTEGFHKGIDAVAPPVVVPSVFGPSARWQNGVSSAIVSSKPTDYTRTGGFVVGGTAKAIDSSGPGAGFTAGNIYKIAAINGNTIMCEQDNNGQPNGWGAHHFLPCPTNGHDL